MDSKTHKPVVMISSTALDLPDHRNEVRDACLRAGIFPLMMDYLPALDTEAIDASIDMVNQADVYVGVFAHRYGYVPKDENPKKISITEMEYNRAVERGIPRFIFLMHEDHALKAADFESGAGVKKLEKLKDRLKKARVISFFKSPEDLRAHVLHTLSEFLKTEKAGHEAGESPKPTESGSGLTIPSPPETYTAHPYPFLQTHDLIGRREELNLLTDWVVKPDSDVNQAHILSITAIGGMGKSALTWKWFNDIAPEEMKPLAGRMWWSFYESDATFENFIIRALAYMSRRTIEEVQMAPAPDREAALLATLSNVPYLIVLDGLERLLIAYARGDAARLKDSEVESGKNFRKTSDPRVGQFLRKLARTKRSRILLSTRLFPAELETTVGDPLPGVFNHELEGLTEGDALALWRTFDISGARDELRPVFDSIERHPLLIQALAGEIKRYKRDPGNLAAWRRANPQFNPAAYPHVKDSMAHVMEYALRELDEKPRHVLEVISAFHMPTGYPTLAAILTGGEHPCGDEMELDAILVELEDRGLVGWDRPANRYDLHPIVRGVVWDRLGNEGRRGAYSSLHAHFDAAPKIKNYLEVNSLEDLTSAIELYQTLIGLSRYDEAQTLFGERLDHATLWRLSASRQRVELLEQLFPDGLDQLPRLADSRAQAYTLCVLAQGYQLSGQPGRSLRLYHRNIAISSELGDEQNLETNLENLSEALRLTGGMRGAEAAVGRALTIACERQDSLSEAASLYLLGLALAARGEADDAESALRRSLRILARQSNTQGEGLVNSYLAQRAFWLGEFIASCKFADRAWILAHTQRHERDFIGAARAQGEAALGLDDLTRADERLHHALSRARAVNLVEEELPALIALAELRRRQEEVRAARDLLDDVWESAERGPYPLLHADALNVLAQIERDAGNGDEAIKAATKAYELSWCDGPPYAYHWGLIKAQKHLEELGAPLPKLPPFDESKFEPMPDVEIDPEDEFHVGASSAEDG